MMLHHIHIVNLSPKRHHKITERVDNTTVPSNLAPSEFSTLYVSRDRPRPAEFYFSSSPQRPFHMTEP